MPVTVGFILIFFIAVEDLVTKKYNEVLNQEIEKGIGSTKILE